MNNIKKNRTNSNLLYEKLLTNDKTKLTTNETNILKIGRAHV